MGQENRRIAGATLEVTIEDRGTEDRKFTIFTLQSPIVTLRSPIFNLQSSLPAAAAVTVTDTDVLWPSLVAVIVTGPPA